MSEPMNQVMGLRRRLRLQMLVMMGLVVGGLFASGGTDVVARALRPAPLAPALQSAPMAWENDAFRLVYTSPTSLTLMGLGWNGGSVNINGTLYGFPTDIPITVPAQPSVLLYAYAYVAGTAVSVELSPTTPTANIYGKYANKTGDVSRRYLGMAWVDGYSHFTPSLVRSVKNEQGYAFMKKIATVTQYDSQTSLTNWTALTGGMYIQPLCFEGERYRLWVRAMNYVAPSFTSRNCHLGVSWEASTASCDDSETVVSINRGTAWALPFSIQVSETYVTATTAGIKIPQACHKGDPGAASDFFVSSTYPGAIGFELIR